MKNEVLSFNVILTILSLCPGLVSAQQDHFADAEEITLEGLPANLYSGGARSSEPGEPNHAGSPAISSIWFKMTLLEEKVVRITEFLSSSSGSTRFAVYTGSNIGALNLVTEKAFTGFGDRLFFLAEANTTYHISCDSAGSDVVHFGVNERLFYEIEDLC